MKGILISLLLLQLACASAVNADSISTDSSELGHVTLTFDEPDTGFWYESYVEAGFRLLPACHYHINPSDYITPLNSQWFSVDYSGCSGTPEGNDANPGGPSIRLDRFGQPFHLLSLDLINLVGTITSSRGGSSILQPDDPFEFPHLSSGTQTFSGSEWRRVTWIDFLLPVEGAPCCGFDNVYLVAVPEPGTLALLGAGLIGIGFARRRKVADA